MDIVKQQYKEKNNLALKVMSAVLAYMLFSVTGAAVAEGWPLIGMIQVATIVLGIIIIVGCYLKFRTEEIFLKVVLITYAAIYQVILLTGDSMDTYIYIVPAIFLGILYMNNRYMILGNLTIIIGNLLDCIQVLSQNPDDSSIYITLLVRMTIFVILMYTSTRVAGLLKKFSQQELAIIEEKAEQQKRVADRNAHLAMEISGHFQDSQKQIRDLVNNIEINCKSIGEIASSCDATARAIEEQNEMTYEIDQNVRNANKEVEEVIKSSDKSKEMINHGIEMISELKEKTAGVKVTSEMANDSVYSLLQELSKIENMTEVILNISEQTNLLALNASIEAARAGEYGKGFAVVAEEIRKLSIGTQQATSQITELIRILMEHAKVARENMKESAETIENQHILMDVVGERFVGIGSEIENLHSAIENMSKNVEVIVTSTAEISNNISQLSASTEEVSALAQSGVEHGENSKDVAHDVTNILEQIYDLTKKLSESY